MPSLSFHKRFADRVERGEKTHSIRPRRKRPEQWMPGKHVHLFTGMRTRFCRRLGVGEIWNVYDISISEHGFQLGSSIVAELPALEAFAKQDGFENWQDFLAFFRAQYDVLPWEGTLIVWKLLPKAEAS